ncbi:MAG TPA: hypothetical protein VE262_16575 [Blastocatellia bacterium]|nr:hypothetical protein [Blastocatellia bacterium]
MKSGLIKLLLLAAVVSSISMPVAEAKARSRRSQQSITVVPHLPVAVAPGQPEVSADSTAGIINALCQVKLNIVACPFLATAAVIACDTNGDGVPELAIRLNNVTHVNALLTQATLDPLSPQLPATAFPLACCGGIAGLTLTRTFGAGDDNVFGETSQSVTCAIDLGLRAPVVISASPSEADCSVPQDLIIPGSCFIQPDGLPNVTSVFAVERGNPSNVIHSSRFVILSNNFIDALFDFGPASAGRTFLIFASGPNGTSRNLTELPEGAPEGCPLGNEQGVQVTVTCRSSSPPEGGTSPPPSALVQGCSINRSATGVITLDIIGRFFKEGATVQINGQSAKKLKFKEFDNSSGIPSFNRIVAKGRICRNLPGLIVVTNQGERASLPFQCNQSIACNQ